MSRRRSLGQILWPHDEQARQIAIEWAKAIVEQALGLVWCGFDHMQQNELSVALELDEDRPEQLERELTQWHAQAVLLVWARAGGGYTSFVPGHELHEVASRKGGKAMPPSNDMGFTHRRYKRWILPVEAKVLPSAKALAEYLEDVNLKYVGGVAAPIVGEGGMIGYLLAGSADDVFDGLTARLGQRLRRLERFEERAHRTSSHVRTNAPQLRIHHMVMSCASLGLHGSTRSERSAR